MSQQPSQPVELSGQESNSLRDYISSHHTTVLTVMFTDIKGYTELTEQKGETYVEEIRRAHDVLLSGIIEADNSGLILKHIGDSVMAVFAEPSRAVHRAIEIQQQLVSFNKENTQWDDIEVRIGLHMGQVTVEGEVTFDIFGRHVNRAARIEGLADGGQVYMSYTVFDSARSWLSHH
ncbi:MAG: adenylate/guanylate cyclase domain-containing protein, partial [Oceanospirillum sp.]|nr:adenylate/guanylate cyclase domain-containing protein [Oceanospirillum sp.]